MFKTGSVATPFLFALKLQFENMCFNIESTSFDMPFVIFPCSEHFTFVLSFFAYACINHLTVSK